MKLIQVHEVNSEEFLQAPFLIVNNLKMTFSAVFDAFENSEATLIFNSISELEISQLNDRVKKDKNHKIIFIAHVLYDYHAELIRLLKSIDISNMLFLVDNNKDQYLISELQIKDMNITKIDADQFLYLYKVKKNEYKINFSYSIKAILLQMYYLLLKVFLKPQQTAKDLYATYNFTFFYGKIKVFFINTAYQIRHASVMSGIKLFYSTKVSCIRSAHYVYRKSVFVANKIFYSIRHFSFMVLIRLFYGAKVGLIRSAYWILDQLNRLKIAFFICGEITFIKLISLVHYSKGYLIWLLYRLQWLLYRVQWLLYRVQWLLFRLYEFNMNYTFYPIRKIFWFLQFQFKKRILKNTL